MLHEINRIIPINYRVVFEKLSRTKYYVRIKTKAYLIMPVIGYIYISRLRIIRIRYFNLRIYIVMR